LLEFPARIGAQLGGCPPATVRALREFGLRCGEVFLHAEDVQALRGERTRLDTTLEVMLAGRFSGIPDALGEPAGAAPLADPAVRARAMATASEAGDLARRQALAAVADVPVPAARRILVEFAETAAAPVLAGGDKTEDRPYRM
jgi:geranylgeranyl pyrophosphate synthase